MAVLWYYSVKLDDDANRELTTIRQTNYKMGLETINMMIEHQEGNSIEERNLILNTELIIRNST